eukprot:CAMPEP_0202866858 /NCGR_PEP_ID=MMETSP1391-20130828/8397_1 /ASSEMBLY_ACC=CAM_ASM_000867 /TAXON_ID=1034604 /ORGANISM="Chlamydomonas leiostraca, Strain SAG 11-49" /LENGTH=429 /DNA_ID=CAMNT_0049546845 /DNA_START=203 /DNA_END=1492 /DNA_ORIENTATION=-
MSRAFRALLSSPLSTRQGSTGFASLLGDQPSVFSDPEVFDGSISSSQGSFFGSRSLHSSCSPRSSFSGARSFLPALNADAVSSTATSDRSTWHSSTGWSSGASASAYVPRGYACSTTPSPSLRAKGRSTSADVDSRVHMLRATAKSSAHVRRPAKATPISQGVAYMVSRDQLSPQHLQSAMSELSTEFVEYAASYSVTEVAAWCEVCRQLGFAGDAEGAMADAVLSSLEGRMGDLTGEEVVGVMWVLARRRNALSQAQARALGEVIVNAAAEIRHEDLPDVAAAVASLALTDAFMLCELAEVITRSVPECTPNEVVALCVAYEDMGRTFFDDRLFKALADAVVSRCSAPAPPTPPVTQHHHHTPAPPPTYTPEQLQQMVAVFRRLAARHTLLQPPLAKLEAAATAKGVELPPAAPPAHGPGSKASAAAK